MRSDPEGVGEPLTIRAGADFVAADMPNANRLTVGIMAMVAEEERRTISTRTKAALQSATARGTKLGGYRGTGATDAAGRAISIKKRQARSQERSADLAPIIADLRAIGATFLREIAAGLTSAASQPPAVASGRPCRSSECSRRHRADQIIEPSGSVDEPGVTRLDQPVL